MYLREMEFPNHSLKVIVKCFSVFKSHLFNVLVKTYLPSTV